MNRISLYLLAALLIAQSVPARAEAPKAETIALADIEAGAAKFNGQIREATIEEEDSPKEELFRKYGTRTFTTFKKHPEIVASLRKLNPKFDPQTMATSDLSSIATVGGKTLLILSGCFPHNCGGTNQVVVFEPATKRVYLLQPTNVGPDTEPSGKFYVYGSPDETVRAAMYKVYPR
jgi:hypothetical protein